MWNMTLWVCLNKSIFLLFSLLRELSPFLLHKHVLSLQVSKLFILSLHSLYKFHVSCFVFSHFNSLPPASLSSLLHFNCDFHGYLTRSRLTCIKCPLGINLLLVLKPRLFGRIFYLYLQFGVFFAGNGKSVSSIIAIIVFKQLVSLSAPIKTLPL